MKIGIFGDSYADINNCPQFFAQEAWPSLLAISYNVENHSKSSSSLEWSFNELINCDHKKYSHIIFVVSESTRLTVHEDYRELLQDNEIHIPSFPFVIKENSRFYQKEIAPTSKKYREYFVNEWIKVNRSMVYTKYLRDMFGKKILLLNGFGANYNLHTNNEMCLQDLFVIESLALFNTKYPSGLIDKRACHLTDENNKMLYNKIVKWLHTGKFRLTKKDVVTKIKDPEKYQQKEG